MLDEALRLFDETAFEPERWPTTLDRVGEMLDANFLILFRWRAEGIDIIGPDHGLAVAQAYDQGGWYTHDLRTQRGSKITEMKVATDRDLITEQEHETGDYYRDFAARHDIPHVVGWRFSQNGENYCFSANRTRAAGAAGPSEKRFMRRLQSRATAAAVASVHMARARAAGLLEGLSQAGVAAVALARNGAVFDLTPAARALLCPDLMICEGRLQSCDAVAQRRLAHFAHAVRTGEGDERASAFVVKRCSDRFGILALPVFCKGAGLDAFPGIGGLLLLKDLDPAPARKHECLRAVFGFTPGEAEIAAALGIGASPADIAETRRTSINTVRHMMKGIYGKMDVSRASEAAAILSRFLATLA